MPDGLDIQVDVSETPGLSCDLTTEDRTMAILLREKGPINPEVQEALQGWTEAQEAIRNAAEDSDLATVLFEVRRGPVYYQAGYVDDAHDAWNDAMDYVAETSGRPELTTFISSVVSAHPRR